MSNKNPVDELVDLLDGSGVQAQHLDLAVVGEAKRFCEEPATEIELLRWMAQLFLEAHEQDDLWIDGIYTVPRRWETPTS